MPTSNRLDAVEEANITLEDLERSELLCTVRSQCKLSAKGTALGEALPQAQSRLTERCLIIRILYLERNHRALGGIGEGISLRRC